MLPTEIASSTAVEQSEEAGKQRLWPMWLLLAVFVGVLVARAWHYITFLSDDALISLRYSERLIEGRGLTWTAGRPVEGYSNLLWVLAIAGLGALGMDLIFAARFLGTIAMAAIIPMAIWCYVRFNRDRGDWMALIAGLSFYSLAVPIAVWSIGGLEQPLIAVLLAASIPLFFLVVEQEKPSLPKLLLLALVLGSLSITRPDGFLFTVAAGIAFVLGKWSIKLRTRFRDIALLLVLPALFYGGQLIFRLLFYGEYVPNTALAKLTPSDAHLAVGVRYIARGALDLLPFSALAIVALILLLRSPALRARGVYLATILAVWLPYVAVVGGDIFPAYRHLVAVVVVLTFALTEGGSLIIDWLLHRGAVRSTLWQVGAVILAIYVQIQALSESSRLALGERWTWDGIAVGHLLNRAFESRQPLVAVTAAGSIPYSSKLPSLDMLGLNDYYLPRHPPPDLGQGFIGHELGDGAYVLRCKPDIVVFHTGIRYDNFRGGKEMQKTEEFNKMYIPVIVRAKDPVTKLALIWVRSDSEKVGIQRKHGTIEVPGYLLTGRRGTTAFLNDAGRLVLPVGRNQPLTLTLEGIDARQWTVQVDSNAPARLDTQVKNDGRKLLVTFSTEDRGDVEIASVTLRRKEASPS